MSELKTCVNCIMDTTDPDISFDNNGVCSHCTNATHLLDNHWHPGPEGLENLKKHAQQIKRVSKGKDYDCLIGLSGGVDSSYLLHFLVKKLNLRPLALHVDCGWNSEIAVRNIETLVKQLDVDLYTHVVDWNIMRDLQLAFLKSGVANQDTPQDHAIFATLSHYANKNGIKYIVSGSNFSSESILPNSWGYCASDLTQIRHIHKLFGKEKFKSFPTMSFFQRKIKWPYVKRIKKFAPLNYMNFDKSAALEFLQEEYDWRYYGGKHHESNWTKYFQSYYLPTKFGYDKRKAHLSSLIASGQLTRDEAMREIQEKLYDEKVIEHDRIYIAKKLGISLVELTKLENLPNKTYLDYKNEESVQKAFSNLKNVIMMRWFKGAEDAANK
ncbi:N-acetyl sugar amidotransferase [Pseudoalteromonas sp. MMG012]|uniref:N-acetyl sugar amidotransferase n=1 Tax=Pseudoalteromonas sp. MMG012 TaxID=2822686 RepID=UPI001B39CFE5|nr:N-acetyl sugar amidotransferase [Pseudoalteromonas sp. MMG012]MBQ4849205.1 N-acetyl sugar amidotransferase [Pseudoalteromonas sp. MMG012]